MSTRSEPWPEGAPCWVDLGTPDVAAARDLYAATLGWSYAGGDGPAEGGYLMCRVGDRNAAGLAPQQDPDDPPRWTSYFATSDADAAAARVREHGGRVVAGPFDVGPSGRMAIALDPGGVPFGLWQAGDHIGAGVADEPGAAVWTEAQLDDTAAGRQFYGSVLGWRFDPVPSAGEEYWTFSRGDALLGGLGGTQEGARPRWLTYFAVAGADAAVQAATSHGATLAAGPMDSEWGRMAYLTDPWGASFAVLEVPTGSP